MKSSTAKVLFRASLTALLLGVVGLSVCLFYFQLAGSLMAFLRGATLCRSTTDPVPLQVVPRPDGAWSPLEALLAMPAPPEDEPWSRPTSIVDPDRLAEWTISRGFGNCSNKSGGLARLLERYDLPFRIVMIGHDPEIRSGRAHVVVETQYRSLGTENWTIGLLDPLAGTALECDGKPISLGYLRQATADSDVQFAPTLRPGMPDPGHWYQPVQGRQLLYGSISASSIARFHRFTGRWAAWFGDGDASRQIMIATALIIGTYPMVELDAMSGRVVSSRLRLDVAMAVIGVWSSRVALLAGGGWILLSSVSIMRRFRMPAAS